MIELKKATLDDALEFAVNYDEKKTNVEFRAEYKEDMNKKYLVYVPAAKFYIALYYKPARIILSVFFPMLVLAFALLTVFLAQNDLNARVANIGVILMAYVSFIPSLRAAIPSTPYYTLTDYALYSNLLACLITLIESLYAY